MQDPAVRRVAWSSFVATALDNAAAARGINRTQMILEVQKAGASRATVFRWLGGDWTETPGRSKVEAFCAATKADIEAAATILGWGRSTRPRPHPVQLTPEIEEILRKLRDPKVSKQEKYLISETLRTLAARPDEKPAAS